MRKSIISDPEILGGTPVFAGTRIPLDHVAGLIRKGVPEAELAEDFPSLNKDDLEYARSYSQLHDTPGGAQKPLKVRRSTEAA